jgi:hypothetical protein
MATCTSCREAIDDVVVVWDKKSELQDMSMLICTEIRAKNGHSLHRKLTHLLLPRSLKGLLFAVLGTGHFQVANAGSIQRANQQ